MCEPQLATAENQGQWVRMFSSVHGMDSSDWDSARAALTGLYAGFDKGAAKKFDGMAGLVEKALKIYEGSRGLGKGVQLKKLKAFVGDGFSADSHFRGLALAMCAAALNAEKGGKWSSSPKMEELSSVLTEDVFMIMQDFGHGVSAPRSGGVIRAYFEQSALEKTAGEAPAAGAASLKL